MYQHGGDIYTNKNCMDFSANINFMGMPASVQRAAAEAVGASVFYPDPRCRELRCAIAAMEDVPVDYIFCGNGAVDVIFSLAQAVRPRRALLPVPSFHEYRQALDAAGCEIVSCPMREKDGFLLCEDFLNRITPDIQMIFLCNPNNPTGLLTEKEFLKQILRRCEAAGTWLVLDECFMDLTSEQERYSMLSCTADSDRLFVLKAFTKSFAMPGLRLGYGVCRNRKLLDRMEEVSPPWRVSVPAQAAGTAAAGVALETDYLSQSREIIRINREKMTTALRNMGFVVWESAANFIFFKGKSGLAEALRSRGILIRDCGNFEGLEENSDNKNHAFYRTAVRSERENEMLLRNIRGFGLKL